MTDPFVALVFFALVLLAFCGVWGLIEAAMERRARRDARAMGRRMRGA